MSLVININIHTGNAAFGETVDDEANEVVRILRDLANKIESNGHLLGSNARHLNDFNGNQVGFVAVDFK
jgi:hypothetical protein